jgi:hypothetical protein
MPLPECAARIPRRASGSFARNAVPLQASPIQQVRPLPPHAVAWRGKVLLARVCVHRPSAGKRELRAERSSPPGFAYPAGASSPTSRGSVEGQGPPCPSVRPSSLGGQAGACPSILQVRPLPPHAVAWRGKVLLARVCVHRPSAGKRELAPPSSRCVLSHLTR